MGLLNFALRGNYKRFYGDLKEISKNNGKPALLMFADCALSVLLFGAGLQDYLNYKFYEKGFKERKTYVTIGYMNKVYKTLAPLEYSPFISNKISFHKNYSDFTKREFFSPQGSYDEFLDFLSRHDQFVLKPQIGLGGHNVEKINADSIEDKRDFYDKICQDNDLIEELIVQDKDWGKLSPDSINTLRVMTTAVNGHAEVIFAAARIGSGKSIADNFHQGGQAVLVDMDKGCLSGDGFDKKLNFNSVSVGGVKYDGFKVPFWDDIKKMVLSAALVNDNIHIVGWDVAISENGPLIIEGNRGPGFDLVQILLNKGTKYMLSDLLDEVKANKKS